MAETAEIFIDGQRVAFQAEQTIMMAAHAAGIYIPHLCHHPELKPHGSCRLCVVEVNGHKLSACTTLAQQGQIIRNQRADLIASRRCVLQLLFVEGNHVCPACEKSGDCQLQALAYAVEMISPRFAHFYPQRTVDASHPDILLDYNRCILCELCLRASRDVDHKNVFSLQQRGDKTHLSVNSASGQLADSTLALGDKAMQVCPVGALLSKQTAYQTPIGARLYDQKPIAQGEAHDG